MKDQALYDRLVARIRIDEATGCWLWTGPAWLKRKWPQNRYGMTTIRRNGKSRTTGAHRAMMIAIHGPLTPDQCACHKCDVPLCVNPDHLFVGSMKDNIWDSRRKGRHYESMRDTCERGHPLYGDNVRYGTQKGGRGVRRTCKTCEKARYRLGLGWPEHLAYDMSVKVPGGYMIDRTTGIFVPGRGRRSDSAPADPK